jgi:hypothetical protein
VSPTTKVTKTHVSMEDLVGISLYATSLLHMAKCISCVSNCQGDKDILHRMESKSAATNLLSNHGVEICSNKPTFQSPSSGVVGIGSILTLGHCFKSGRERGGTVSVDTHYIIIFVLMHLYRYPL